MCDDQTVAGDNEYLRMKNLTRRQFGVLSAGAGLSMLLPRTANAQEVSESEIDVTTPDGVADCYFVHPSSGAHPGVLIWPDAFGLRPAKRQMARRLAASGYSVLVVNQYYRTQRAPIVETTNFAEARGTLMPLIMIMMMTRFFGANRSWSEGLAILPFAIFGGLAFTVPYYLTGVFLGPEFPTILGALIGMAIVTFAAKRGFLVPKKIWDFPAVAIWPANWTGKLRIDIRGKSDAMPLWRAWTP